LNQISLDSRIINPSWRIIANLHSIRKLYANKAQKNKQNIYQLGGKLENKNDLPNRKEEKMVLGLERIIIQLGGKSLVLMLVSSRIDKCK